MHTNDINLFPKTIRDSLRRLIPFQPLYLSLKEEDFDVMAKLFAKKISFFDVRPDGDRSKKFAEVLSKYKKEDGEYLLIAGLYASSWITMKKRMLKAEIDMDAGLIKKAEVCGLALFTFSEPKGRNLHHVFKIHPAFYE